MKIEIEFQNNTDYDLKEFYPLCNKLIDYACDYLKFDMKSSITYIFINDEEMTRLNTDYRNKDKTTDVLTFCSDEDDYLADVFISFDVAKEHVLEYNHSIEKEMSYLFVHGFLHALGYDHEEDALECEMFDIQDKIVEEICKD